MKRAAVRLAHPRLRPARAGALALASLLALPAPALGFLLGLALAAGHGPHRVLVHAESACTDIVLAHESAQTGAREPAGRGLHHPAPALGERCASHEGAGAEHVICVSHLLDARGAARDGARPEPGATATPLAYLPLETLPRQRAATGNDVHAALALSARTLVLRL